MMNGESLCLCRGQRFTLNRARGHRPADVSSAGRREREGNMLKVKGHGKGAHIWKIVRSEERRVGKEC